MLYRMMIMMKLMMVQLMVHCQASIRMYITALQRKGREIWRHLLETIWWHPQARHV